MPVRTRGICTLVLFISVDTRNVHKSMCNKELYRHCILYDRYGKSYTDALFTTSSILSHTFQPPYSQFQPLSPIPLVMHPVPLFPVVPQTLSSDPCVCSLSPCPLPTQLYCTVHVCVVELSEQCSVKKYMYACTCTCALFVVILNNAYSLQCHETQKDHACMRINVYIHVHVLCCLYQIYSNGCGRWLWCVNE